MIIITIIIIIIIILIIKPLRDNFLFVNITTYLKPNNLNH